MIKRQAIDPATLPAWILRAVAGALIPGGRGITTVERLCRVGELTWRPGRPVMVETASVLAYIARTTRHAKARPVSEDATSAAPGAPATPRGAAAREQEQRDASAFRLGLALGFRTAPQRKAQHPAPRAAPGGDAARPAALDRSHAAREVRQAAAKVRAHQRAKGAAPAA